jgi:DNA-binding winged helix-turn-helix (wHTH) protein/tetratricopeptide (TPR) repeat protein
MSSSPTKLAKELYEFGPFCVDVGKEVLLRAGEPVPLTPKTFQILVVLVRHNNEVVTKDDLMKAVWPDTFVEEGNLSRNIFMLRKALGDSTQHRYIVTVPGRGYRLAESVRLPPEQEVNVVAASHSRVHIQVRETRSWAWIALAAVLALAIAAVGLRLFWHRAPILTQQDTIVLADFANSTGDAVFDGTLRQGLAVQLEQSPFLSLVSQPRIGQTLKLMGRSADAPLTGETAREVCERTGGSAVLVGSIASLGNQYVIGLKATNCRTGEVLDEEQAQANQKEDVLRAVSQIASRFRTRAGESLTMLQQHDRPLEEATTPSLDALKAYSAATKAGFSKGWVAGIPLFQRAIEIDPNFAMAHAHLALWYSSMGEPELAIQESKRAYELRKRASDRESFFILAMYQRQVTGNLEKQVETLHSWSQMYPRDPYPHGLLSGFGNQGIGRYTESIEEATKSIALDPDFGPGYINRGFSQLYLGRLDDAEKTLQQAAQSHMEIPELMMLRYHIAFLRGDRAEMERAAAAAKGKPGAEDWMLHSESLVAAHDGQLARARELSQQAVQLARQTGEQERAATYGAAVAVWEAFYGQSSAAKRDATTALKLSKGRDVEFAAAFAFTKTGDLSRANALASDLQKRFPQDTSVQFSYLPTLRGMLALSHHDAADALAELQVAEREELGQTGLGFFAFFGNMYPAYVRGEAYLAQGKTKEAAAEFQKFVDHPGMVIADPAGVMARRELAKLGNQQFPK